jgi:hypothetical protein
MTRFVPALPAGCIVTGTLQPAVYDVWLMTLCGCEPCSLSLLEKYTISQVTLLTWRWERRVLPKRRKRSQNPDENDSRTVEDRIGLAYPVVSCRLLCAVGLCLGPSYLRRRLSTVLQPSCPRRCICLSYFQKDKLEYLLFRDHFLPHPCQLSFVWLIIRSCSTLHVRSFASRWRHANLSTTASLWTDVIAPRRPRFVVISESARIFVGVRWLLLHHMHRVLGF